MSLMQPTLTTDQKNEIRDYINVYRTKHQAPPLNWDDVIYNYAQQWSFYMLSTNLFQHSTTKLYGENLAYYQGYGTDVMTLLKKAVDDWYNEVKLYNFNNPGFSSGTGHFTCLVWKSSTNFGMGISIDTTTNKVYISMNTSPPGNYQGQYQDNVLPVVGTTVIPVPTPSPTPLPIPTPPTNNKRMIILALYNIINSIQSNQSKTIIIKGIYDLIKVVNSLNI
jgi:hypothetical protein